MLMLSRNQSDWSVIEGSPNDLPSFLYFTNISGHQQHLRSLLLRSKSAVSHSSFVRIVSLLFTHLSNRSINRFLLNVFYSAGLYPYLSPLSSCHMPHSVKILIEITRPSMLWLSCRTSLSPPQRRRYQLRRVKRNYLWQILLFIPSLRHIASCLSNMCNAGLWCKMRGVQRLLKIGGASYGSDRITRCGRE